MITAPSTGKRLPEKMALMVNNYTDERSQQIYCLINKGRVMKMPFDGLTLLDHAINASLVLSNVALVKQDKAGTDHFCGKSGHIFLADKKPTQMNLDPGNIVQTKNTIFLKQILKNYFRSSATGSPIAAC